MKPKAFSKAAFEKTWKEIAQQLPDDDRPLDPDYVARLATFGTGAIEALVAHLGDDDLRRVFTAGLTLARLHDGADTIVPLVVPVLRDKHPLVAELGRWILRELGEAAMPALMDAYASNAKQQRAIAQALACLGPRAESAAMVLREDARRDKVIGKALAEIVGPWPSAPQRPVEYLGEVVRMDLEGPPPLSYCGLALWLDSVHWAADMDETIWDREARPEDSVHSWWPDQIAIDAPSIVVGAYDSATSGVVKTTLEAPDGKRFTKQQLLWAVLDAHHRIAPCNDRIFEGLKRERDGSYYISTGS